MHAAESPFQKVLEGLKQFVVPHFQRPYTWEQPELNVLWGDLIELVEQPESKPHFIGSFVTAPARSVPEGVEKRLVIDGQQRITTLVLLLAILRMRAKQLANEKLAERAFDFVCNRHEDGIERYKLLPSQGKLEESSDRDALLAIIDGEPLSTSKSRVQGAYLFFDRKLREKDAPKLEDLYRVITTKLTIVSIILDERDNAYRIFESLNGKGRPLSQADLIRNYFFMRLPSSAHESAYNRLWLPMQTRLGEENLTEFFRHYLMGTKGLIVNIGELYATVKERFDRRSESVEELLAELAMYSTHYECLLKGKLSGANGLSERLARINRLGVTIVYPFLLEVLRARSEAQIADDAVAQIVEAIETFLVRRFVCAVPTNALTKIFAPLFRQTMNAGDFVDNVKRALAERSFPSDETFREQLTESRLYGHGERRDRAKFILERLEASFAHKESVPVTDASIEHVMPQKLSDTWKRELGEEWEVDHQELLHTLGNLTLTKYNSELSNDPFIEKQNAFAQSHFDLNRYFASVSTWNAQEITKRGEELAEIALRIWPSFAPVRARDENSSPQTDVTGTVPFTLIFAGVSKPVSSWAEVLLMTLERVVAMGEESFAIIFKELPRIVSDDASKFVKVRRLRKLSNGAYVETNLSAIAIHRACLQIVALVGLSADDWCVEYARDAEDDHEAAAKRDDTQTTALRQLQAEFWEFALPKLKEALRLVPRKPNRNWCDISTKRADAWLSLTIDVAARLVSVKCMMNDSSGELFASVLARKADVEASLGQPARWNQVAKKQKSVRLDLSVDVGDRATWPEIVTWFAQETERLHAALMPIIDEVER